MREEYRIGLWMLLAWLLAAGLLLYFAAHAEAHSGSTGGAHNHNDNTYLDIYRTQGFSGNLKAAISAYNAQDIWTAPQPRFVDTPQEADVVAIYDTDHGAYFLPRHGSGLPDVISQNPNAVEHPVWVWDHEIGHAQKLTHHTLQECRNIVGDPEYPKRKSIMCHLRWDDPYLPPHDVAALQTVGNHWDDASTPSGTDLTMVEAQAIEQEISQQGLMGLDERPDDVMLKIGDPIGTPR